MRQVRLDSGESLSQAFPLILNAVFELPDLVPIVSILLFDIFSVDGQIPLFGPHDFADVILHLRRHSLGEDHIALGQLGF